MSGSAPAPGSPNGPAATAGTPRGPRLVPRYSWRIWLGWIAMLALVAGLVAGAVYTTKGYGADEFGVGFWVFAIPATVVYFEAVNSRRRRSLGVDSPRSPGLPLAAAGLVIGWILVLLGPLAFVLGLLGWRRIRSTGVPYGAGTAAAVVAMIAGGLGTVYLAFVLARAA